MLVNLGKLERVLTVEDGTDFFDCEESANGGSTVLGHASKPAAEENREDYILNVACPHTRVSVVVSLGLR